MPDTRRTLSALQTLLADNTSGDISAQDVRDVLVSVNAQNSVQSGTYASLPATCQVGDLYLFTDSIYPFARATAVDTWTLFLGGKAVTRPGVVSGWTAVNAGSDLVTTDYKGAIQLHIDRNATLNWRGLFKSQPSTPYTLTFQFDALARSRNSCLMGCYFYDGTKLMSVEILTQSGSNSLRVGKITNVTTDGVAALTIANNFPVVAAAGFCSFANLFFRLANSGSTLTFSVSYDGNVFTDLFSEAVGTFITPDRYGFGGVNQSGTSTDDVDIMMKAIEIT